MSNYPPILTPAMELIKQLQATVAAQQARINELSAMLGLDPLGAAPAVSSPSVTETKPTGSDYKETGTTAAEKSAGPETTDMPATGDQLYTDQPLIIDGTGAFESGYVNDSPNCYKLVLNGARGTFTLNEAPEFYEMLAYSLADMVMPVADYTVDEVPDGNGGFGMADLADCRIVNVEPGEILLDDAYWKITKKAKVQFKAKNK